MEKIGNGVFSITFGECEQFTATSFQYKPMDEDAFEELFTVTEPGFDEKDVEFKTSSRGITLTIPMTENEHIYGFGLQMKSLEQFGKKKTLRTNADPVSDTGDSHAPAPFYVSSGFNGKPYGIFVDSLRYVSFYCGSSKKVGSSDRQMTIEVPNVKGVKIYVFSGDTCDEICQKYILFSGGGCMPALSQLGVWYRADGKFNQNEVMNIAKSFKEDKIPVSVIGLEPGWHTHAYSCSYEFSPERYPDHKKLIDDLHEMGYDINLWEHLFVHPSSPIYEQLRDYSADYEVWGGLVPDFGDEKARKIFGDYHKEYLVESGINGFKLDECDGSDYTGGWSYPNHTVFPSGTDGEQMHAVLPLLYQQTILSTFNEKGLRTYGEVRAQHGLAAPYPFVLYSDLYDHKDFINGLLNMGTSGLLFSPEIREAVSVNDLYRRILTGIFSPKLEFNIWYMKNPPWFNFNGGDNNKDIKMQQSDEVKKVCKELMELRMKLVPYLYTAFFNYYKNGIHPFRALQLEYDDVREQKDVKNGYSMGECLLVYPLTENETEVSIYLPNGVYFDFFTNKKYIGGQTYTLNYQPQTIPVFVKEGSIIPMLLNTNCNLKNDVLEIVPYIYGNSAEGWLYEDDGNSYNFEKKDAYNIYTLTFEDDTLNIDKDDAYEDKKVIFQTYVKINGENSDE